MAHVPLVLHALLLHVSCVLGAVKPRALGALVSHVHRALCASCALVPYVPLVSLTLRPSYVNITFSALVPSCFT